MTIEGWSIALLLVAYFYLRQNFVDYPPARTPFPSLLIPSINLAIMLLSFVPAVVGALGAQRPLGHERLRLGGMGVGRLSRVPAAARCR